MRYGIDWLVIRADLIFGLGWLGVPDDAIGEMNLELTGEDGSSETLPVSSVRYRDVISPILGKPRHGGLSGFIVYGTLGVGDPVRSATLRVRLKDGGWKSLDAPFQDLVRGSASSLRARLDRRRNQARRVLALLRQRMFSELMERVRIWRSRRVPMRVSDPTPFLEREIERASGSGIVLVIDHALGGGANRYREELVRERLEEGDPVGVVSFNLPTLQYTLELHARGASRVRFALASLEPLRDWAAGSLVKEIFFNDAVSFPNPAQIPRLLADLKEAYGVRLAIATHDYFVLCPSPYLLDHEGGYCDLPSPEVCRRCLPRNRWVLFGHGTGTGIEEWRAGWGRALASADRILCYSDSSRQLLLRVFPWLQGARIETRPHLLEDMPVAKPSIDLSAPLILGVVGTITYHKGSGILRVLGDRIRARSLDVRIVVLGTLDEPVDPDVVTVTGSYRRNHLPRLIEKSGANLMLLPSVVPETFSYVAAELMQMEVPLVCFDIGAPAERIARYPLGQVIPLDEPDAILDRLIGFHEELREGAREPQPV